MKHRILLLSAIALLATACNKEGTPQPPQRSKWISRVVEYRPAPGQFVNTSLGNAAAAQGIVGGKIGCLSLGGFGGSVIFEFDHDVQNIDGTDFVIFGNAFDGNSEPGIVTVSPNGTDWYPLKGSEQGHPKTLLDYTIIYSRPAQTATAAAVPWIDNKGGSGEVGPVSFHTQCYYPLFLSDNPATLTFAGTRLPDNSVFTGEEYDQTAFAWGYADNWSPDYNDIAGDDKDTRGSNKFDLDNAVDLSGNPVKLNVVRQVKVYTALNQMVSAGVGETSTEVCGALSLSASLSD